LPTTLILHFWASVNESAQSQSPLFAQLRRPVTVPNAAISDKLVVLPGGSRRMPTGAPVVTISASTGPPGNAWAPAAHTIHSPGQVSVSLSETLLTDREALSPLSSAACRPTWHQRRGGRSVRSTRPPPPSSPSPPPAMVYSGACARRGESREPEN
jgi:hypothetical protein